MLREEVPNVMEPPAAPLMQALTGTQALLLDFDGPVCEVFAGRPAAAVADELRGLLVSLGAHSQDLEGDDDPLSLFARSAAYGPVAVASTCTALARSEREAVVSATPTPGALETIQTVRESGRRIAIVSNNAAEAVLDYLDRHNLTPLMDHVAARRAPDPDLMKPNPRYVLEAVNALGVDPRACTIVGDTVSDIEAATRAGTRAVGYANKPGKADRLAHAGAVAVIDHMGELPPALATTPV